MGLFAALCAKENAKISSEQERVQQALKDHAAGNEMGAIMYYDPGNGRIHAASGGDPDRKGTKYTSQDFGFGCES